MSKRRRRYSGPTRPRRSAGSLLPPLPAEPPPHVVAFHDQLDAAVRAGDLPDGQRWHLDVRAEFGAALAEVSPRLCTAPDSLPCFGACS